MADIMQGGAAAADTGGEQEQNPIAMVMGALNRVPAWARPLAASLIRSEMPELSSVPLTAAEISAVNAKSLQAEMEAARDEVRYRSLDLLAEAVDRQDEPIQGRPDGKTLRNLLDEAALPKLDGGYLDKPEQMVALSKVMAGAFQAPWLEISMGTLIRGGWPSALMSEDERSAEDAAAQDAARKRVIAWYGDEGAKARKALATAADMVVRDARLRYESAVEDVDLSDLTTVQNALGLSNVMRMAHKTGSYMGLDPQDIGEAFHREFGSSMKGVLEEVPVSDGIALPGYEDVDSWFGDRVSKETQGVLGAMMTEHAAKIGSPPAAQAGDVGVKGWIDMDGMMLTEGRSLMNQMLRGRPADR